MGHLRPALQPGGKLSYCKTRFDNGLDFFSLDKKDVFFLNLSSHEGDYFVWLTALSPRRAANGKIKVKVEDESLIHPRII